MLLADGFVVVWIIGALLIGLVGFFAILLSAVVRLVCFTFRWLARGVSGARPVGHAELTSPPRRCRHPRCGHLNPGAARYCARCGHRLHATIDDDCYG